MRSRTPRILVAALLTFAAGSSFGQSPPLPAGPSPGPKPTPDPAEQAAEQANVPVFPAQAEVVTVDVVVNDKKTNGR